MSASLHSPQISSWYTPTPSSSSSPRNAMDVVDFMDHSSTNHSTFDDVLTRLQLLSLPSQQDLSLKSSQAPNSIPRPSAMQCYSELSFAAIPTLDTPFSLSYPHPRSRNFDNHVVTPAFTPRHQAPDLSPVSSVSSDFDSVSSCASAMKSPVEAFFATRSRVVRLYNLPASAEPFLSAVFHPQGPTHHSLGHIPISMWQLREEYSTRQSDSVWAVFKTHEEACAALSLSGPSLSVGTALESDLEPFHKLKPFQSKPTTLLPLPTPLSSRPSLGLPRLPMLRVSSSYPDFHASDGTAIKTDYTLSSNPPNPKTSFRTGDWMCPSPSCAAHNFGRNLSCIGCGCPRSDHASSSQIQNQPANPQTTRALPSPRFNSGTGNQTYYSSAQPSHPTFSFTPPQPQPQQAHTTRYASSPLPPSINSNSGHPLLTPSGQAFAVGGKVQNISSDPLNPCVMYWPDNESFPEQGQIRPSGLVGIPQPPILNTGNRGPISHQPGDWICQKCNYLNWRRRKVCQTCLPYAEGNGDSISAAVQAERIALLASVLAKTQLGGGGSQQPQSHVQDNPQATRSHSLTPPQICQPAINHPPAQNRPVHRSQSHFQLGVQYSNNAVRSPVRYNMSSPIYQTSGHQHLSPLYSTGPPDFKLTESEAGAVVPAPLLPSFLQDIVQSPASSPTSTATSSADFSVEEYQESASARTMFPRMRGSNDSMANSALANIWRLDGEESKVLSAFPLPNHRELIEENRKDSREKLRVQVL